MSTINFRTTSNEISSESGTPFEIFDGDKVPKGDDIVTDRKLPRGCLIFEDYAEERNLVLQGIRRYGAEHIPPNLKSPFKEHFTLMRVNLDLWERIPIKKAISKYEIISRCMEYGPSFAEWLKKARYYSFVDKVCEGGNEIPEEYVIPEYCGYDSLFRETELIHWKENSDDVEYAFIEVGDFPFEEEFRYETKSILKEILPLCNFPRQISTLDWIKSSRGYDPSTGKTLPVRDELRGLTNVGPGYLGKRTLIRPFPGGIRDSAIPDADSLAKIKLCHNIFREICEHIPESGMSSKLNQNFDRVLKRSLFCHLDFKKAGLTFPRRLFVVIGEELEKQGVDAWFIRDLEDIYIDIDGETYRTKRGFCLGWVNEGLTLSIIILLRLLRKKYGLSYDFIVYNDDVLIGDQDDDPEIYSELFRFAAKEFFNSFQIFLSEKKIFTSRSAQFLEEYYYQDLYGLDMEKRSASTALYAKSLCSQYIWEAKMYCEAAYSLHQDESNLWDCMSRGRESRLEDEPFRSYKAGGWITPITHGLDNSLENFNEVKYILALGEVHMPNFAEKVCTFSEKKASDSKHRKIFNHTRLFGVGDEVRDFLKEQSLIDLAELVKTRLDCYRGRKKIFPIALDARVQSLESKFWDPP